MAVHELSLKTQAQMKEMDQKKDGGRMSRLLEEAAKASRKMPEEIQEMRDLVTPENIRKMAAGMQQDLQRELARRLRRLMEKPGIKETAAGLVEMENLALYAEKPITCRDAQLCERFCEWLNLEVADVTGDLWALMLMAVRMKEHLKIQAADRETVEAHLNWTLYQYADLLGRITSRLIEDMALGVTEPYGDGK